MGSPAQYPIVRGNVDYWARAFSLLDRLPAFSPALRPLLANLSADEESISLFHIADLIEKDALLSGKILSVANSALYGRSTPILSVRRAVARLGTIKLRNMILGLSINRMWGNLHTPPGWSPQRFNSHAMATATLADVIAMQVPAQFAEGAFVAGLFHDIGRLIIAALLSDRSDLLVPPEGIVSADAESYEREVLGFTHSDLSASIMSRWNMPVPIQTAVRFHEHPDQDPTQVKLNEIRLSNVVHAADEFVNARGLRITEHSRDAGQPASLDIFATEEKQSTILARFEEEFQLFHSHI
jgi:HD-like signal output (HDOD) protein